MNEKTLFEHLLKVFEQHHFSQRNGKFLDYRSPSDLSEILDLERPAKPGDWQEILHWVDKYLAYSPKTSHPAFVDRM